jgi:hypothetical protein
MVLDYQGQLFILETTLTDSLNDVHASYTSDINALNSAWDLDGNSLIPDCSLSTIQDKVVPITLYPNPTNNLINVDIKDYRGPINVKVYDFTGKLLRSSNEYTISFKSYNKGMYLLKIAYGNVLEQIKVIKQ